VVFTACNRRDCDVIEMGEILGHGFDRVILYRDRGNNERADGELNAVLRRGLAAGRRVAEVVEADTEQDAAEAALRSLRRRAVARASYRPELQPLEDRVLPAVSLGKPAPFAGLAASPVNGVPPDTTMAVGKNFVLEAVNNSIALYNRADGTLVQQQTLNAF